jgi:hypothetical protein
MLDLNIDQDAFDALPERLQEEYKKNSDGSFDLTVPTGLVPKVKVDEFRKTNVSLKKKLEAFGDLDPEEAKEAVATKEELAERIAEAEAAAEGNSAEKIREQAEALANQRIEKVKATHEKQLGEVKAERDGLKDKLHSKTIGDALRKAGTAQGIRPEAIDDLIARGNGVFKVDENGNLTALDSDGETPKLNDRGDAFSPSDFVGGLVKTAPHLFGETKGSETKGSSTTTPAAASGVNPWMKETLNVTMQGQIMKDDPQRAKALAAKAGKVLVIGS